MSFSWKEVGQALATAAPAIGTLLGGPAGAAIGTIIAAVVKVNDTPESVAEAIHTSPTAVAAIQNVQNDASLMKRMYAMDIHGTSIATANSRIESHLAESLAWVKAAEQDNSK